MAYRKDFRKDFLIQWKDEVQHLNKDDDLEPLLQVYMAIMKKSHKVALEAAHTIMDLHKDWCGPTMAIIPFLTQV